MSRRGENIYKRKDGRWEGRYIKLYEINGKAKYGYVYAKSYKEIRDKLNEIRIKKPQNEETKKNQYVYGYWLDKWLEHKKNIVKTSTLVRYRNIIYNHIYPCLGNFLPQNVTTEIVEKFISNKLMAGKIDKSGGLSSKTVRDILTIIKSSLKYASRFGAVNNCDFNVLSIKSERKEMRVLSTIEEKQLIEILLDEKDAYKLGVFICLFTGIRIGELCALKWGDISFANKTLTVSKTMQRLQNDKSAGVSGTSIIITEPKSYAAKRVIPLPDFMIEMLLLVKKSADTYVLSTNNTAFTEPRTMQNKFKTYLRLANISDANFHALRHTFATRCIEAGFDVKSLSEILGHSSVKITLDKYVHSSMNLKRDNMEKLSSIVNLQLNYSPSN